MNNYSENNSQELRSENAQTQTSVIDDLIIRFIMNCPDEVFESFDRLFFQIEEAHWFYEDFYREQNKNLPSLSFKQFVDVIFKQCPALQPYREGIDSHTLSFYKYKNTVPVFGAIILNQARDKVLLVKGWTSKSWSFPRGKVNQDESEMVCAAREVKEEIGFDISPYLKPKNFLKMHFNEQVVTLFIVSGIPENTKFHPESRKEVSAIEWHSIEEISSSRSPSNPKRCANKYWIISSFMPRLKKWLSRNPEASNQKNSSKRKLSPKSAEHSPTTEVEKKRGRRGRKSPVQDSSPQQQKSSTHSNARKLSFDSKKNNDSNVSLTVGQESSPISILKRTTTPLSNESVPSPTMTSTPIPFTHPTPQLSYHAPPPQYVHGMYPYPQASFMYNPYVHMPQYHYSYAPHAHTNTHTNQVIV